MIQWPTLATLILWPFVLWMYYRLARKEEAEVLEKYPDEYRRYMSQSPMFFPRLFPSRPAHDIARTDGRDSQPRSTETKR